MCPDWESILPPFLYGTTFQSNEPHWPGPDCSLHIYHLKSFLTSGILVVAIPSSAMSPLLVNQLLKIWNNFNWNLHSTDFIFLYFIITKILTKTRPYLTTEMSYLYVAKKDFISLHCTCQSPDINADTLPYFLVTFISFKHGSRLQN